MDFWELLKDFGPSIVGAGVGLWIGNVKSQEKVVYLQADFADFKKTTNEQIKTLKEGWRLELDSHKGDLEKKIDELKKELKDLDDSFDRFVRDSQSVFADEDNFRRFVEEANRQWQQVQRTLGQIEGLLSHPAPLIPSRPNPPRRG